MSPNNKAAGALEFRPLGGDAFLNHIGILPEFRRQGGGRLLLWAAMDDFLALYPARRIWLDVDPRNTVASRWYGRLGFAPQGKTYWQLGEIQRSQAPAGALLGTAQAAAMHRKFGSSQVRIETREGAYVVGRLGRAYFRLDGAAWDDSGVHAALRLLDAKRRILLVTPAVQPGLPIVRHTHRLAIETALLSASDAEALPNALRQQA